MKYIYIYTTETYRFKNWYKIGESIHHPDKRILQQDNASNPEPLIILKYWEVNNKLSDKTIHNRLETCGFSRLRNGREWFELSDNPVDDVESCFITGDKFQSVPNIEEKSNIIKDIPHYTDLWWHKSI